MSEPKMSPKLVGLCQWKYIQEVNKRLDQGESPNSVCSFINKKGYKISSPLVYEYAKLRKKALVDGVNVEHILGIASQPTQSPIDTFDPDTKSTIRHLKSEIDAIDLLIGKGYETLKSLPADTPIPPKIMLEAIKLKNELTDGHHGFLTNYGMEQLRAIEQNKYQLIIEHLVSYIPEELQQQAVDAIAQIEDEYYRGTEYYEEYLKALDIPESEKAKRLKEYLSEEGE